jgi:hypothetical protein
MDPDEIIERGRRAYVPSDDDRARVRRKLAVRVGAAAFAGGTMAKATAGSSIALKLGVVAVAVAVAMGAYWTMRRHGATDAGPQTAVVATAPVETAAVSAPIEIAPPAPAPPPAASAIEAQHVAKAPPPARAHDSLEAETALLADAQQAIIDHDWARALAKLDEHEKAFPQGVLAEERIAARVVALCGSGRVTEARTLRAKFSSDHPRSPMAKRIRAACPED